MIHNKIAKSYLVIILLVSLLSQFSTDIYLPSIPAMAEYFHQPINHIQYTLVYYTVGFSCGALIYGPISDRIGRKRVLLFALSLALIGSLLACFALNLVVLNIARFIQGFAFVGGASLIRAFVRDISSSREDMARISAILGLLYPVAIAFAPVIGGYVEHYLSWRFSFVFLVLLVAYSLYYSYKNMPDSNKHNRIKKGETHILRSYWQVISNAQFLIYNLVTACALCAFMAYQTISSYLLQVKLGISPEGYGYTNLILSVALIIAGVTNAKLSKILGIDKMLHLGIYFIGLAGVILLITDWLQFNNLYVILFCALCFCIGNGFVYPNASAGGMGLFSKSAGTAGAVYACFQMLGGVFGSWVMSLSLNYAQAKLGVLFICLCVISVITLYFLKHPKVQKIVAE